MHFLQIWILPERRGITPGYEQKTFPNATRDGALRLVASQDGRADSLTVHADVAVHAGMFTAGQHTELPIATGRHAYVQVVRGQVRVNGHVLHVGDGAALSNEPAVQIEGIDRGELLVFDLA